MLLLTLVARQYPGSINSVSSVTLVPPELTVCSNSFVHAGLSSPFSTSQVEQGSQSRQTASNRSPSCVLQVNPEGNVNKVDAGEADDELLSAAGRVLNYCC